MFPLSGRGFPDSPDALAEAIRGALADVFDIGDDAVRVTAAPAGGFPRVRELSITLDDTAIDATNPPPKPAPAGQRQPGIEVDRLHVSGKRLRYEDSKLDIALDAKDVKLDFAKDKKGRPLLVLSDAADGHAEAKISKADLRALVMSAASAAAKQQGVTVKDIELDLRSDGPRSVELEARVEAKKAFVSGVVRLAGRADVDDELNATLSDLSCTGEGMIGKMASGFLQAKLQEFNGRSFPLMAFSLGDVTLRDLKVDAKAGLHVKATFGSR
jgi:hypothetical protein